MGRRKRIRPVNPERKARLREEQFGSEAFRKWVRMQHCVIPHCEAWPAEAAHVVSRGAGGTWEDIVPICRWHHEEQHRIGIETFQERHGVDLKALAEWTQARWTLYLGVRHAGTDTGQSGSDDLTVDTDAR